MDWLLAWLTDYAWHFLAILPLIIGINFYVDGQMIKAIHKLSDYFEKKRRDNV